MDTNELTHGIAVQSSDGKMMEGGKRLDGCWCMNVKNYEISDLFIIVFQAVHKVPKVTAREMCEAFWDVQYRLDWEITVDQAPTVIEVCGDDTVLQYQVSEMKNHLLHFLPGCIVLIVNLCHFTDFSFNCFVGIPEKSHRACTRSAFC